MRHIKNLIPDAFLREYWQKKPLLIRQAFPNFQSPIDADELAGLALEEEVESRLILEKGAEPWELRHGPFTEEAFASLPKSHWTLLVQAVDHWVPEINELLKYFHFLPSWRLEDIMMSYAADGGNVGPHYDQFDVFLLQAEGKRHWSISSYCDDQAAKVANTPLHILADFTPLEEYVLEPGDMLYLPPGIGHHGVAQGECMTISVGFRAPSHRDILMQFTDFVADRLDENLRYADGDLKPVQNPGEIDPQAINRVQHILNQYVNNRQLVSQWFGEAMTEPKHPQPLALEPIPNWLTLRSMYGHLPLQVSEGSRIAFLETPTPMIFSDGVVHQCTSIELLSLAKLFSHHQILTPNEWTHCQQKESQHWLVHLLNSGIVFPAATT